jgi:hypothetical protein
MSLETQVGGLSLWALNTALGIFHNPEHSEPRSTGAVSSYRSSFNTRSDQEGLVLLMLLSGPWVLGTSTPIAVSVTVLRPRLLTPLSLEAWQLTKLFQWLGPAVFVSTPLPLFPVTSALSCSLELFIALLPLLRWTLALQLLLPLPG